MALMTRDEFIAYAHEATSTEALEPIYERISECASEIAMFGDSGPGSLYHLYRDVAEVKRIEARLAQLMGREPRDFRFRLPSPR